MRDDNSPRRSHFLLCLLFLILLVARLSSFAEERRVVALKNPLHAAGLTVLDATSSDFMSEIQTLLDTEAISKTSSFLPYSLVVINNTGRYIWGFTVVYSYPDWISPSGTAWKHRISPSAAGPANRARMLAPGTRFLITPVSDFLASRDANGNRMLQPFFDDGLDRMIQDFESKHTKNNERVEASIDSIIFEDGTLAGPDSEGMMRKVNDRIRAEKDLAASVSNLRGEDLRKKLLFHAHKDMSDEYSGRLSDVANSVFGVLNSRGEPAALEILDKLRTTNWFPNAETVRRK
ncbi:MAG TPA: hypothetical protein VGK24_20765 [Candidatus Angelobacter sp.]|jgi:hypothetical protein